MTILNDDELAVRIEAYFRDQLGSDVRVESIRRFPVGFSWLTYCVSVTGLRGQRTSEDLILRLGPSYGLFAPYTVEPQVLSAQSLEDSAVPLPRVWWSGNDASLFGAPFIFCEKVTGDAVVPWVTAGQPGLDEDYRKSLGSDFIDALAALHCVDWTTKPIASLADDITAQNAALVNVEYWEQQIERWALRPCPLATWGLHWLKGHAPVAPRVTIVHGDYRTGNFLEEDGRITSILDWELAHLGDPHEDLGWASLPMYMGGTKFIGRLAEPQWFYSRYAEKAGFEVSMSSVRYYQIFSLLKLAATHMAAARCFEEGRFNDMRMPAMGSQIAACLRQMEKAIEQYE